MESTLEVFSDLSERLNYNLSNFPLYVRKGKLAQFDRYAAACHWHSDLEFILILDGTMEYFVNGQTVSIDCGNGLFINRKRLHYGFSTDRNDCTFIVVAIHPVLLGDSTPAGKMYLDEVFGSNTNDFILLSSTIPWQQEAMLTISQMYDEINRNPRNLLGLLSLATSLCAITGDHVQQVSSQLTTDQSWMIVCKMTGFIHRYYDQKITLEDIAAAGTVCRSRCCELFGNYISLTPNTYLTRYRIQKSCEMLRETNRSIIEIAIACGFQSGSYFSHVFRKEMGFIPQEYRKQATK
jgi:AraC-like DNA-binding protein